MSRCSCPIQRQDIPYFVTDAFLCAFEDPISLSARQQRLSGPLFRSSPSPPSLALDAWLCDCNVPWSEARLIAEADWLVVINLASNWETILICPCLHFPILSLTRNIHAVFCSFTVKSPIKELYLLLDLQE
ncbi:hypothetical protein L9F63_020423, partial [Diploptera punctata]